MISFNIKNHLTISAMLNRLSFAKKFTN